MTNDSPESDVVGLIDKLGQCGVLSEKSARSTTVVSMFTREMGNYEIELSTQGLLTVASAFVLWTLRSGGDLAKTYTVP